MYTETFMQGLKKGEFDQRLMALYLDPERLEQQRERYLRAVEKYVSLYGHGDIAIFSAPGRTEIGGNHTDHQHGCVLAGAINLDAIGVVGKSDRYIKILSDAFDIAAIDVTDVTMRENEKGTSEGLVRGVLNGFKQRGYQVGGFNAYLTSDVLIGAGMSSSAAFEVLIGTILSHLYQGGQVDPIEIAKIGQYAENVYFGKPCGLMDQCASSVGGLVNIDFADPASPIVRKVEVDFSTFEHALCILDTKGSHADLTPDYAAVPAEMKAVAAYFGQEVLRDVKEAEFYAALSEVRAACHDRAVLRAIHFFEENQRVAKQVESLSQGDFAAFKYWIAQSGKSSFEYLQNVYSPRHPEAQGVSLALALSEKSLGMHGVCRVHGGGFAGTIQAFVENQWVKQYQEEMEGYFGKGTCHVLKMRKEGGVKVFE